MNNTPLIEAYSKIEEHILPIVEFLEQHNTNDFI